jgi:hypothetical protein
MKHLKLQEPKVNLAELAAMARKYMVSDLYIDLPKTYYSKRFNVWYLLEKHHSHRGLRLVARIGLVGQATLSAMPAVS